MPLLDIGSISKATAFSVVSDYLDGLGIVVVAIDDSRPWGEFFVVADQSMPTFLAAFFPGKKQHDISSGLPLTPKILVVEPQRRLSWQYHYRREEIWTVLHGPVGVITSETDEPTTVRKLVSGSEIAFGAQIRHRLIGFESYGVVAEFWRHIDFKNPSNEADIIRVQDDFGR